MRYLLSLLLAVISINTAAVADEALEKAIKKDRAMIEGKWTVTALTVNGNKSSEDDARKLTVVNGNDGTWSLWSEGEMVAKGTSTIDPSAKPKTIDFAVTEGGNEGETHLGIYQLRKNKRKLCFAPAGKDRPTEFVSKPGTEHALVVFERIK